MGALTIGKDVTGGYGYASGFIDATALTSVTIGGNVIGGTSEYAGSIYAYTMAGAVKIGGNLVGGDGEYSGSVNGDDGSLSSVSIGKNVIGGQGSYSGLIFADTNLQSVTIGGDLTGAGVTGTTSLTASGAIWAGDHLGSVTIQGSIIAGTNSGTGSLTQSGAVLSDTADIGSITVMHDIIGNATTPVQISAVGQAIKPASGSDVAIGSLTVDGSVSYLNVLAGFTGSSLAEANADAVISSITVKGDWSASNAVAGAHQANPPNWGVGDSLQSATHQAGLTASITSIVIGGALSGAPATGEDFGFVAAAFGGITVGGHAITITSGQIPEALTSNVYLEIV